MNRRSKIEPIDGNFAAEIKKIFIYDSSTTCSPYMGH